MSTTSSHPIQVEYKTLLLYLQEWLGLELSTMWLGNAPGSFPTDAEDDALNVIEQMMVQHGTIHPRLHFSPKDYAAMRELRATMLTCSFEQGRCVWWIWQNKKGAPILHRIGQTTSKQTIKNAAQLSGALGGDPTKSWQWVPLSSNLPLEKLRMTELATKDKVKKTLLRVKALLLLERGALWTLFVYAIFVGLMSLLMPLASQIIVSSLAFTSMLQPLIILTIAILMGLTFAGILKVFEFVVVEFIQRRIFFYTVQDTTTRLLRLDRMVIQNRHVPELVNRFFDIMTVQKAASSLLLDGMSLVLQTFIGLIVLAFYHPLLLAFDIVLIFSMVLILFVLGRGGIKTSLGESNAKYTVAAWLEDIANAPHSLKSDQNMARAMSETQRLTGDYLTQRQKHFRVVIRQIIAAVILQIIANAALIGLGGWLVLKGQLTLGQLVAAELIVTMIVAAMVKFGKHFETFYDLCASIYKLGELIDLPLETHGTQIPKAEQTPSLTIDEFTCQHSDAPPLSRKIHKGDWVALIDTPALYATQLLQAMFGFHTGHSGRVKFNDVPVSQWALPRLRRQVVLIEEIEIFSAPLHANVFWAEQVVDSDIQKDILETLDLERLARQLPEGWETKLLPHSERLHPSDRLAIVLARHLLQRPDFILVDKLFDSLDLPVIERWMGLLKRLNVGVVVATSRDDIATLCPKTLCLSAQSTEAQP